MSFQPNLLTMAERTLTGAFCYEAGPKARTGEFAAVIEMLAAGACGRTPSSPTGFPSRRPPERSIPRSTPMVDS